MIYSAYFKIGNSTYRPSFPLLFYVSLCFSHLLFRRHFCNFRRFINRTAMKVTVNRTTVELFEGARSQHAVLRYLVHRRLGAAKLRQGRIYDACGHEIGLEAPLHEGQIIKFKITK